MKEYVEREALRDYINNGTGSPMQKLFADLCVLNAPTANVVEVRHGEWVEGAEHFTNGFYEAECSECGNYIRWNEGNSGEWNYCPNCGADMRGEKQ